MTVCNYSYRDLYDDYVRKGCGGVLQCEAHNCRLLDFVNFETRVSKILKSQSKSNQGDEAGYLGHLSCRYIT